MASCILRDVSTKHNAERDEPTIVTTIRLSPNQRERLKKLARADERSVTYLVRRAVDELIEREAA